MFARIPSLSSDNKRTIAVIKRTTPDSNKEKLTLPN